ncbi:hypothetical protein LIER_15790 [Lithospermum erythrorhizon]|uniref:Uncharacterized protein n=1 Tax=Lithospermum erythrorhizon TaxID=34254 RepID=A0AAV3Q567_LITER
MEGEARVSKTTGLSGPSVMPFVNDRCEMDDEPSVGAKSSRDAIEGTDPGVEDVVPDTFEEPNTKGLGYTETLNEDVEVLVPSPKAQKSKKRKLRKMSEDGPSEPKQKLTREERATKKAPRADRQARKAARKAQRAAEAQDTLEKEVDENAPGRKK